LKIYFQTPQTEKVHGWTFSEITYGNSEKLRVSLKRPGMAAKSKAKRIDLKGV